MKEGIIEKFVEQAKKNSELEKNLEKIKCDFKALEEQLLKIENSDRAALIIDLYKAVCEKLDRFYIKDGCLFLGENNVGAVCGKNGENGKDGRDGLDGKNGKDGVSPEITVDEKNIYVNGKILIPLEKLKGKDGKDGKNGKTEKGGRSLRSLFDLMTDYGFSADEEKLSRVVENLSSKDIDTAPVKDSENLITSGGVYDRLNWKLIGETTVTQEQVNEAEEGVTGVILDLGEQIEDWYGETMIKIYVPVSSDINTNTGTLRVSFGVTEANSLSSASSNEAICSVVCSQSENFCFIKKEWKNSIILLSQWLDKKTLSGTQVMVNGFSAYSYPYTAYATSNHIERTIEQKRFLGMTSGNTFYFPAGTEIKIYGRF